MPDYIPLWAVFAVTVLIVLVALEEGYRVGRYRRQHAKEEGESPLGTMVAALLGLLAFLLTFTFGLAASRFEANRGLILDESNAIGTAYLRAGLLPEPYRTDVRDLLLRYVDVRLNRPQDKPADQAIARAQDLQMGLWSQAVAVAEKRATPTVALFVQSLNELIDVQTKRAKASLRSRIPIEIWIVLYLLALSAMAAVGFHMGLTGTRRSLVVPALVLSFATVMLLIADLERPFAGMMQVSQQALLDTRRSMAQLPPAPSSQTAVEP